MVDNVAGPAVAPAGPASSGPDRVSSLDGFLDWLTASPRSSERELVLGLAFAMTVLARPERWRAQLFQDAFVATVLDGGEPRRFVEIGVGDGLALSNSAALESLGWTGLLVEPNETFCTSIATNRPTTRLVSRAVLARGQGSLPFRHVRNFAELSTLERFAVGDQHDRSDFEARTVETVGVADLFQAERISPEVDYVSIDVEGPDAEILEAMLEAGFRPKVLTVEHNWTESQLRTIRRVLAPDYEVVLPAASKWDLWAVRRDILGQAFERLLGGSAASR